MKIIFLTVNLMILIDVWRKNLKIVNTSIKLSFFIAKDFNKKRPYGLFFIQPRQFRQNPATKADCCLL